jgi:hypothetical protein
MKDLKHWDKVKKKERIHEPVTMLNSRYNFGWIEHTRRFGQEKVNKPYLEH